MKLILKSKRLILRPPKLSDASILEKYINDRLVSRYLTNVPFPYPKGGMRKWIKQALKELKIKKSIHFIIIFNNEPVGSIGFNKIDFKHKKAGVGYWLAMKYWGQGVMSEAFKLILNFGFNQLKLNRIWSAHFKENNRSKMVQEKGGLKLEGIFRQDIFKDKKYHDIVRRAILVSEYKKLKKKWNIKKS
jgi:[ribosomal protein S5]-alanine N-acetyltransferase